MTKKPAQAVSGSANESLASPIDRSPDIKLGALHPFQHLSLQLHHKFSRGIALVMTR